MSLKIIHDIEVDKWVISDPDGRSIQVEFDPRNSNSFMELEKDFRNTLKLTASFDSQYDLMKYRVLGVMQAGSKRWDNDCTRYEMVLLCKAANGDHWLAWIYVDWPRDPGRDPEIDETGTQIVVFKFDLVLCSWRKTSTHMRLTLPEGILLVPKHWFHPTISGDQHIHWLT